MLFEFGKINSFQDTQNPYFWKILQKKEAKVTWYMWGKNMQLLDVLFCNSANKPSFQNPTKGLFLDFEKMIYLAELQVRMSRYCRFLLFSPHKYQVSLMHSVR